MSKKTFQSAEVVVSKEGTQYHIGVGPKDVAPNILLCGDPARAYRVAEYFESKSEPKKYREYVTITGKYKGIPISVMATGMGPDNTEIAVVELFQLVKNPTLIRIGSSGALRKGIELGDLVISTGAVRMENTSTAYVWEGYPCVANYEAVLALVESARKNSFRHHVGITATASGFYGRQGRKVPGVPILNPDIPKQLEQMNVANMEMETSCLFSLSSVLNIRAGAVCAIYANRYKNQFIEGTEMKLAEKRCIETGLTAIEVLTKMDKAKGKAQNWAPSMGLK